MEPHIYLGGAWYIYPPAQGMPSLIPSPSVIQKVGQACVCFLEVDHIFNKFLEVMSLYNICYKGQKHLLVDAFLNASW